MLLRNRCAKPEQEQVALRNQSAMPNNYLPEIKDAARHWRAEVARAGETGSGALLSMSSMILRELTEPTRVWARARDRLSMEVARRRVISALGVSMLLRASWDDEPVAVPDFTGPSGELGTLLDIVMDARPDPPEPSDSRVHTTISVENALPSGANEQWYQHGDLWIRQVRPAEPTDFLVNEFLPNLGIEPDFSQFETIYPYVATK
jgi:hypothetical protein